MSEVDKPSRKIPGVPQRVYERSALWHPEPKPPEPGKEARDETPLEFLDYPQRAHRYFDEKNIRTVAELKNIDFSDLRNAKGQDTRDLWRGIHDFSVEHGIPLKYEEPQ